MLVLLPGMDDTGRLFAPFEACLDAGIPVRVMPYVDQAGAGYATLAVDVSTELARVAVPLLYLRATRDVLVPCAASAHIASVHPGAIVASFVPICARMRMT